MNFGVPARVIASIFALAAFAIAIVAGLAAHNATRTILMNAMIVMVVCNVVGLMIGAVFEHAIHDHLRQYRAANEIPELETHRAERHHARDADQEKATSGGG